ncbi:MAG: hypothetical protein ABIN25_12050, partial [Ginsengibacter sp.]
DNISPIRSLTKDVISKDVNIFENKPIVLTSGNFGNGGYEIQGGWYASNPSSIPPIQYYLKDKLNSDVSVSIFDADNKLVQTFPASNRKGINKVYWNLRMTPPKTATGGTKMDYGGFIAPMVLPGTYTMKLKIGDKEYSSPLTLEHNSADKEFSIDDRKLQFKTAMELYNLHEELATLVDSISSRQKMINDQLAVITDSKAKIILTDYNSQLETLRASLLSTTQTSIFSDEERVREKITNVYSAVSMQEAAPSNSQLANVSFLQKEVKSAEQKHKSIDAKYMAKAKELQAKYEKSIKPKSKVTKDDSNK